MFGKLLALKKKKPLLKKVHRRKTSQRFFHNSPYDHYPRDNSFTHSHIFAQDEGIYRISTQIGSGTYGKVKEGYKVDSNKKVAIKIQNIDKQIELYKRFFNGDAVKAREYIYSKIAIEEAILKLTNGFIGSMRRTSSKGHEKHYTIMQYLEASPIHCVFDTLSRNEILETILDLAKKLSGIHRADYLHLDIWRNNILKSSQGTYLIDFGCALERIDGKAEGYTVGAHLPPEVIEEYMQYGKATFSRRSDVFGLGMTFYALHYHNYFEYDDDEPLEKFFARYKTYYEDALIRLNTDKQDPLLALIQRMVARDKTDRLQPWDLIDELEQMLSNQVDKPNIAIP